jgi:hypothetical protein
MVDVLGIFDDPKYAKLAVENAEKYRAADPFPHISFDDFINPELARALAAACPTREDLDSWVDCEDPARALKRYQHDETMLPALLRHFLRELNSRQFVLFVESLTGIESLIPDPYFIGGGYHLSQRGDYLKIHADFNWHHKLQAHRRVNALFYLNEGWDEAWGGRLELWDKGMTRAVQAYAPIFNRLIVFSTSEDSNHGHPNPLACPPGVSRRTLNLYYYTTRRDESELADPHFTLYKPSASPFAMELGDAYRKSGRPAPSRS